MSEYEHVEGESDGKCTHEKIIDIDEKESIYNIKLDAMILFEVEGYDEYMLLKDEGGQITRIDDKEENAEVDENNTI
ncbi:hypothetical protein IWW36_005929, partial [Coemansia brasiliensis]